MVQGILWFWIYRIVWLVVSTCFKSFLFSTMFWDNDTHSHFSDGWLNHQSQILRQDVQEPPSNWRTRTIERTIVCRRFSQTHRSKEGFEKAAAMMKSQEVAILACGGDGTVTWILSDAGANIASSGVRPGQHSCYFSWASIHPQQNCGPSSNSIRARSVLDPGF